MELHDRQDNRLRDYDYSQDGVYFVTICTQGRRKLLSEIVGDGSPVPKPCGEIAEDMILQIPEKYPNVVVDKYVIMPDHIHMLLRIRGTGNPSPTTGTVIGWYKYQLTKRANTIMKSPGAKLLQRSYYDHVIRNQQDYNEIWEYIENNPKAWRIKKQGR